MAEAETTTQKEWVVPLALGVEMTQLRGKLEAALGALVSASSIEERFPRDARIVTADPWKWGRLDDVDLPLLVTARDFLGRWLTHGRRIIQLGAEEFMDDFEAEVGRLEAVTDRSQQGEGPMSDDPDAVLVDIREALAAQAEALRHAGVGAAAPVELLLVPDTSALYANPALEEWAGPQRVTLVLVPQVIRELDKHKTHHPAEEVRKKAVSLIRRFEDIGRRGDTFTGVRVAGNLSLREVALDARADELPEGLQIENEDDRLLASALELKWGTPGSAVVLVTSDRNLRNKARLTRLATDEPPPAARTARGSGVRTTRRPPEVAIGHAGGHLSTTPLSELGPGETGHLVRVEPRYPIENKGSTGIWNVTTGARTRDGREHEFSQYRAQLIGAGETSWVENVGGIPLDLLKGTHPSAAFDAYLYWARFTDADGIEWEIVYDAETRTTSHERVGRAPS